MTAIQSLKLILLALFGVSCAAKAAPPSRDFEYKDGKLIYQTDDRGNRVPDYSYAGYRAGDVPIPIVPAKVLVQAASSKEVDRTADIQAAIDLVSTVAIDSNGFRGAVLLGAGEFRIEGSLHIRTTGVVLRGSGVGEDGTTLIATGRDRRTLIRLDGKPRKPYAEPQPVTNAYVPVNATTLTIGDAQGLAVGDAIAITHPSTKEWIAALGMDDLGGDRHGPSWRPGSRDIVWTRIVTRIDGNSITIDAPLTYALDASLGASSVAKLDVSGIIQNVGVENLFIHDEGGSFQDEEHAWFGIGIDNARDVWVRRVWCQRLVGSAVAAWEGSSRVTVEDCQSLGPNGSIGGLRRRSFFTSGQQVLMQRLYSENGVHDFAVGLAAAGPNAFVQCESVGSLGESGPIDSAACGTLFDRVRIDGQPLSLRNRTYQGQGVGWASFNGMMWNSVAAVIINQKPPTAQNWAFGTNGEFDGNGAWFGSNDDVNPDSLYYQQLGERIGKKQAEERALLNLPTVQGSRAPTIESAAEAIKASRKPRVTMSDWIQAVTGANLLPTSTEGVPPIRVDVTPAASQPANAAKPIAILNGWITIDGQVLAGGQMGVPWWNGGVRPDDIAKAQPALTRFVPGRTGKGLTDDLHELADGMVARGDISVWQHPPLWYDRRRDDHERMRRMDGDVVAPFYETPWARSGSGTASDGLSKWDVTKVNPWYFERLREFADIGEQKGLVLFNGLYMQHSVLEAGAHYADAPWRPANNVNNIGIPEPVFFAGDKLIYVAEQFYDVSNADRAALHRAYMRNVLNELADKPNVILFLSDEYTGPLAFVQFWLDTVAEWERETGKKPTIVLYATKDVTDAILADEKRAAVVSMLYNRFNNEGDAGWWYQPDGTLYAPVGGKNLSPRQWSRLLKPKNAGFEQVMKAVREYRQKYPDKPFVYDGPAPLSWAVLLGGGSLPALPKTTHPELLAAIANMKPVEHGLADDAGNALMLSDGEAIAETPGTTVRSIDLSTGQVGPASTTSKLLWITKKSD